MPSITLTASRVRGLCLQAVAAVQDRIEEEQKARVGGSPERQMAGVHETARLSKIQGRVEELAYVADLASGMGGDEVAVELDREDLALLDSALRRPKK
ncbi:hypothetical protein VQH23_20970 [Pararoseomonas sp. SCSIO 73927]|uniref:hypothetical protein n=1 Tax=Pararoseomonas sp. SCSIO 73927 TaxID=3114537 RepID=UPI0030D42CEC